MLLVGVPRVVRAPETNPPPPFACCHFARHMHGSESWSGFSHPSQFDITLNEVSLDDTETLRADRTEAALHETMTEHQSKYLMSVKGTARNSNTWPPLIAIIRLYLRPSGLLRQPIRTRRWNDTPHPYVHDGRDLRRLIPVTAESWIAWSEPQCRRCSVRAASSPAALEVALCDHE